MKRVLESVLQRALCAAVITLSLPFLVYAQEQDRFVDWHPVSIMLEEKVLEIVDVRVEGKSITIGQPFTANEDWLKTLTFRVRNVSDKVIKNFGFGVAFPEMAVNGISPGFSVTFNVNTPESDSRAQKPLSPGDEIDLKLPEDQLKIMRRVSMNSSGTLNLSRLNIAPGLATFADGSTVGGILLRRREPAQP